MNIIGFMIWNMISHISWDILYDIFCRFSMIISYYENEYDIIIIRMELDILKFYTVNEYSLYGNMFFLQRWCFDKIRQIICIMIEDDNQKGLRYILIFTISIFERYPLDRIYTLIYFFFEKYYEWKVSISIWYDMKNINIIIIWWFHRIII